MIYDFTNYRHYLNAELLRRTAKNPSYSLRSMAKSLFVAPSTLSDVLNFKKNLSLRTAAKVAQSLKLSERKKRYLIALVEFESSGSEELKALLAENLRILNPKAREFFEIGLDQFKLISQWYHYAIMEMTYLDKVDMTHQNLARVLNLSRLEVRKALRLLLKLGLLTSPSNDKYLKTNKKFLSQSSQPNQALRKFHRSMLEQAMASLETQSPQEKIIGSETLPINTDDLDEANQIIEDCFEKMVQLSERTKEKNMVYHLGIQFFNLTTGVNKDSS